MKNTIALLALLAIISLSLGGCGLFGTGRGKGRGKYDGGTLGDPSTTTGSTCPAGQLVVVNGQLVCLSDYENTENWECMTSADCDPGYHCVLGYSGNVCEEVPSGSGSCANHGDCIGTKFCNLGASPRECEDKKPYDTSCNVNYCSNFCESGKIYTVGIQKRCGCTTAREATDCGTGNKKCGTLTDNLYRCVTIVPFGGNCSDLTTTQCDDNLSCSSNNKCKKKDGQSCSLASDCVSGVCNELCGQLPEVCDPASWVKGTACTTETEGCCESEICVGGSCGCYTHVNCPANCYCDLGTGICEGGCTDTLDSTNSTSCTTSQYCVPGGMCKIRCDEDDPPYHCDNTDEFCDRSSGVCIDKLGYNSDIPAGVTAGEACKAHESQTANPNKCGCSYDEHCTVVPSTPFCDTSIHECGKAPNNTPCDEPTECTSNYCYPDNSYDLNSDNKYCGKPNGYGCDSAEECRCSICVPDTWLDGVGGGPQYCGHANQTACNDESECRCRSCNPSPYEVNVCGKPTGAGCSEDWECSSNACSGDTCAAL